MTEVRPIDANQLINLIKNEMNALYTSTKGGQEDDENYGEVLASFCGRIDKSPTLDYAPVIHAKWRHTGVIENGEEYDECSNCKRDTISGGIYDYCPWCGAEMSLGDNGDV